MLIIFNILFLVFLASMVVVYPLYFLELSHFRKIMRRDHSDLLEQDSEDLADAYRILQKVKHGRLDGVQLSNDALSAYVLARKLLYLGTALFLLVLLIGLTDSVLSKQVGG